jgi:glucose/arabinose dehydrogenase
MKKLVAALAVLAMAGTVAIAQQKAPSTQRKEHVAEQDKAAGPPVPTEQHIGERFQIIADELPAPKKARVGVSNGPLSLPFADQIPKVPDGFTATLFAKLEHPRRLLVLPNGDIIVAEQKPGHLTLLRAKEGNGQAEFIERHAEGFNQPYGLAWRDDHVLVADQDGIWRVPHVLGDVRTGHGPPKKAAEVPPDQRKPSPHMNAQELSPKGEYLVWCAATPTGRLPSIQRRALFMSGWARQATLGLSRKSKPPSNALKPAGAARAPMSPVCAIPVVSPFTPTLANYGPSSRSAMA